MELSEDGRPRGKRALGLSVLLHVCAAPLFVVIFAGVPDLLPERISVTSGAFPLTLEHRAPLRAPSRQVPRREAPAQRAASAPVAPERPVTRITISARRPMGMPTRAPMRIAIAVPSEPPTPKPTPTRAPVRTATSTDADASSVHPEPTANPETATPEPVETSVALARAIEPAPVGGWGQNFRDPSVFDDSAIASLRARYHGAALARVDVDEDGRATKVTVEGSRLDADARAEIEHRLSAIRYVPAECNGLRCAASLEIKV